MGSGFPFDPYDFQVVVETPAATYKTINVPAMIIAIQAASSLFATSRMTSFGIDNCGRKRMTQILYETFNVPAIYA